MDTLFRRINAPAEIAIRDQHNIVNPDPITAMRHRSTKDLKLPLVEGARDAHEIHANKVGDGDNDDNDYGGAASGYLSSTVATNFISCAVIIVICEFNS
jgi:hypothetical protein